MEELEAIDGYEQRIDPTGDDELRAILAHNRDEEAEHAAMSLEWLRRHVPSLDAELRDYLFREGSIGAHEEGGYPVLEHLRLILGGPVIWAPAVEGAVVLSQRGGDYELVVGQDLSIGYEAHDATSVGLYIEESVTFRALEPHAAAALVYAS